MKNWQEAKFVLGKILNPPLLIPAPLLPPIPLRHRRMSLPVPPRVAGVRFAPLPPAIADYLGILRIRLHLLAMVVGPPPALAARLPTHPLVRAVLGWLKRLLAIATATRRQAGFLRGLGITS